jgi:hypothetical protein
LGHGFVAKCNSHMFQVHLEVPNGFSTKQNGCPVQFVFGYFVVFGYPRYILGKHVLNDIVQQVAAVEFCVVQIVAADIVGFCKGIFENAIQKGDAEGLFVLEKAPKISFAEGIYRQARRWVLPQNKTPLGVAVFKNKHAG